MSFADLLVQGPVFAWEHAQNHRVIVEKIGQTKPTAIAVSPFYLDPREYVDLWDTQHQHIHDSAVIDLNTPWAPVLTDERLEDSWTIFANQAAHVSAMQAIQSQSS